MDFTLPEELRMLRETVARFAREELLPLEKDVIRREAERGLTDAPLIDPDVEKELNRKAREIGLYGIDVPEEYGGQNLGMLAKAVVIEELKTSIVPFVPPPDSPNLYMLRETCKGDQIQKYFIPYANGEKKSAIAITEPGAGSDPAAMKTRAEYRNGKWVINGQKIFISNARKADFIIVMAVTDAAKGSRGGITAFLVDQGTKGMSIPTVFNTIGEHVPYGMFFDDVEVPDEQVLGEVGSGFAPMQNRLGVRRMEIACRSLGFARRCMVVDRRQFPGNGDGAPDYLAARLQDRSGRKRLAARSGHGQASGQRNDLAGRGPCHADVRGHGHDQGPAARVHQPRVPRLPHLRGPQRGAPLVHRARPAAQRHARRIA
jgi:(R)-benzylsuccinyl-CoA dehydrogenase